MDLLHFGQCEVRKTMDFPSGIRRMQAGHSNHPDFPPSEHPCIQKLLVPVSTFRKFADFRKEEELMYPFDASL
jgi:hypothetical protein